MLSDASHNLGINPTDRSGDSFLRRSDAIKSNEGSVSVNADGSVQIILPAVQLTSGGDGQGFSGASQQAEALVKAARAAIAAEGIQLTPRQLKKLETFLLGATSQRLADSRQPRLDGVTVLVTKSGEIQVQLLVPQADGKPSPRVYTLDGLLRKFQAHAAGRDAGSIIASLYQAMGETAHELVELMIETMETNQAIADETQRILDKKKAQNNWIQQQERRQDEAAEKKTLADVAAFLKHEMNLVGQLAINVVADLEAAVRKIEKGT